MKKIISTFVLFLLVLLSFSQTFHVSPEGNNDFPGTESQPWKTIQYAMDEVTPGSTVLIHAGIYNESLSVNVSGEEEAIITFKAFNSEEVIIDGEGITSYALLELYSVHHVAIEDLTIRNHQQLYAVGILVEEACDHIRIENCKIYDINFSSDPEAEVTSETNAQPIAVYGTDPMHAISDIDILNNEIYDCRLGFSEALVVNGNVQFFQVIGNLIHDVSNIGIDIIGHEGTCPDPDLDQARFGLIAKNTTYNCSSPYATSAGIYVDGARDLIIERNEVFNNQWGIEVGCENVGKSTENIVVRSNLIYGNQTAGIQVGGFDYPSGSGKVVSCLVLNNTLYGNDTEEDFTGEIYITYNVSLYLSRNVFYATNAFGMVLTTEDLNLNDIEIGMINNCFYSASGNPQFYYNFNDYDGLDAFEGLANVNNNVHVDPLFEAIGTDFNLTVLSPLVDQGDTEFVEASGELDFENELRVENGVIDLGAFEFGSSVSVNEKEFVRLLVFPNPTSNYLFVETLVDQQISACSIWDVQGRIISKQEKNLSEGIDVSAYQQGVYVLKTEFSDASIAVTRWIKE